MKMTSRIAFLLVICCMAACFCSSLGIAESCRHVDELGYCLGSIVPGSTVITGYSYPDDTYHYLNYQEDWLCTCGVRHTEYDGYYEEHVYNGTKKCIYCGYGSNDEACRHTQTYKEENAYGDYLNAGSHTKYIDYEIYCADCGEWLNYIEGSAVIEAHIFSDGYCLICGYEPDRGCTHPSRNNEVVSEHYFDPNGGHNIKADGHIMWRDLDVYCDICGELADSEIYSEWLEPHRDNGDGKCAVCGYDMPGESCDHSDYSRTPCMDIMQEDEKLHKVKVTYIISCECGKSSRMEEKISYEAHEFYSSGQTVQYENGRRAGEIVRVTLSKEVCRACGYQMRKTLNTETLNAENTYKTHLKSFAQDAHANPWKDETTRTMIRLRFKEKNLTDEQIDTIFESVDSAEILYQKLFAYSFYYVPFGDFSRDGISEFAYIDGYEERSLHLGNDAFRSGPEPNATIFFHELGHGIDFYAGGNGKEDYYTTTTRKNKLYEALEEDVEILIRGRIAGICNMWNEEENSDQYFFTEEEYEEIIELYLSGEKVDAEGVSTLLKLPEHRADALKAAMRQINKELSAIVSANENTDDSNACMVIDIMDGMTNLSFLGSNGHAEVPSYWFEQTILGYSRTGNQCSEAFAEFFAAKITNNQTQIQRNREYFPYTCLLLEDIAEEMLEYYREKVS